jgi:hypothetical protein
MTPIPGVAMVMPSFRTTAEWGLVVPDRSRLKLPAARLWSFARNLCRGSPV